MIDIKFLRENPDSAVSPPIRAASDCLHPSATPLTMEAIFSGKFLPHAI